MQMVSVLLACRSLFQYNGYFYLIYEGTNPQKWVRDNCNWGDAVGLMRSKTLEGPYVERHPLQISIPPVPGSFDSTWTGWPKAYVDYSAGEVLVLYGAGDRSMKSRNSKMHPFASTGLRRWDLTKLARWAL